MATSERAHVEIEVAGRAVRVSSPAKVYFPARGETKLDLIRYLLAVGDGVLRGVRDRPTVLRRHVDGATGEEFFQKQLPAKRPDWLEGVSVAFPSGRRAELLCPSDMAHVVWAANLGCLGLDPWPVRRTDVDHPDELRVDLDPQPGVAFSTVREVALLVRDVLEGFGLTGFAKTSGSRGMHVYVRVEPRWGFDDVRRAAIALARAVEREAPTLVTSNWWKEERGERVFVDYNQNARDRTVVSQYSVRANPEGRVSCPLRWDEVAAVEPDDLTIATVPARCASVGDPWSGIDDVRHSLAPLLEQADRDAAAGLGDAPWPPHFRKQPGEPRRVSPSRARKPPPSRATPKP